MLRADRTHARIYAEEMSGIALDRSSGRSTSRRGEGLQHRAWHGRREERRCRRSLLNWARVGAARASLDLAKFPDAASTRPRYPTTFAFKAYYSANSTRENNQFFGAASGGANAEFIGVSSTPFEGLVNDPRTASGCQGGHDAGAGVRAKSPLMFSTTARRSPGLSSTRTHRSRSRPASRPSTSLPSRRA